MLLVIVVVLVVVGVVISSSLLMRSRGLKIRRVCALVGVSL